MLNNSSRLLLSDLLPYELPVIFTNQDYAMYISKIFEKINDSTKLDKTLCKWSVPYKYKIIKDKSSYRMISLLNPLAQLQSALFIDSFKHNIIHYAKIYGKHSLRTTIDLSPIYIDLDSKMQIFHKASKYADTLGLENIEESVNKVSTYESFFTLGPYARIHEFEDSSDLIKIERRFVHMLKTDVSNCFNSIYTHSFSWAYTGSKEIAKNKISTKTFDTLFDKLMQNINFGETNGIVVGPNLSRIFAELIFSKIDSLIIDNTYEKYDKIEGKDFLYYRYIDDIFIFANNLDLLDDVLIIIKEEFEKFNLNLNDSKTYRDNRPFQFHRAWYLKARNLVTELDKYFTFIKKIEKDVVENKANTNEFTFSEIDYNLIHLNLKNLIKINHGNEVRITNYITTSILQISYKVFDSINNLEDKEKDEIKSSSHFQTFFTNLMNYMTYISSLNLSYTSVNNLYQFMSLIYMNFIRTKIGSKVNFRFRYNISDIIHIIESNSNKTEISNLIILMAQLKEEINFNTLEFLIENFKNNEDIFILFSVAFHVLHNKTSKDHDKLVAMINDTVSKKLESFLKSDFFSDTPENNYQDIARKFIVSDQYYFFNSFYHYPLINDYNKKLINQYLFNLRRPIDNGLIDVVSKFNGSFIDWNQDISKSLKILLLNNKLSTQDSSAG